MSKDQKSPGGLLVGQTDKNGGPGIKIVAPEGDILMGGGELVLTSDTGKSTELHEFDGKKMTPCEIASELNQEGGGVKIPCHIAEPANTTDSNMEVGDVIKSAATGTRIPSESDKDRLDRLKRDLLSLEVSGHGKSPQARVIKSKILALKNKIGNSMATGGGIDEYDEMQAKIPAAVSTLKKVRNFLAEQKYPILAVSEPNLEQNGEIRITKNLSVTVTLDNDFYVSYYDGRHINFSGATKNLHRLKADLDKHYNPKDLLDYSAMAFGGITKDEKQVLMQAKNIWREKKKEAERELSDPNISDEDRKQYVVLLREANQHLASFERGSMETGGKIEYPYTIAEWASMLKEFYRNNDIDYSGHTVEMIEQDLKASPYGSRLDNKDSWDLAAEIERYFEREKASGGVIDIYLSPKEIEDFNRIHKKYADKDYFGTRQLIDNKEEFRRQMAAKGDELALKTTRDDIERMYKAKDYQDGLAYFKRIKRYIKDGNKADLKKILRANQKMTIEFVEAITGKSLKGLANQKSLDDFVDSLDKRMEKGGMTMTEDQSAVLWLLNNDGPMKFVNQQNLSIAQELERKGLTEKTDSNEYAITKRGKMELMEKGGKTQLQIGIGVEKEHKDLYQRIKKMFEANGMKMPISENEFYKTIAKAHIREDKYYYDKLLKYVE